MKPLCLSKTRLLLCFLLIMGLAGRREFGALAQSNLWKAVSEPVAEPGARRYLHPKNARYFHLDFAAIKAALQSAPSERSGKVGSYGLSLSLPLPDGSMQRFAVASYEALEKPLAGRNPEIRTFLGQGIDDPSAQIYLDFTQQGFHAQILSARGSFYIDPVFLNKTDVYLAYDRKDFSKAGSGHFSCGVGHEGDFLPNQNKGSNPGGNSTQFVSGTNRKTYRIAIAATAEYTAFHGGTAGLALSAITTTLNRVNGIYARDLTVQFTLVANNNLVIYTANPDPYTNGDPFAMIGENNSNLNTVLGSSSYDIGHVFGTNSGGLAGLGVVCGGDKGRGVTGSGAPIGDPFDVDYVAHEVGHQFNGRHTFNGNQGSCNGNISQSAAVEPGSGITIMAYAGICGSDNLAPNSVDHFHNFSQTEILSFVQTGGGSGCGFNTSVSNGIPTLSVNSPTGRTIPQGTPYRLSGSATDPDGDVLSYCWEQNDVGSSSGPPNDAARTNGPITRSFSPAQSGDRTVPSLTDLINNTSTIGNLLGSATRTMNYKLTVRDNRSGGGATRDASYAFNVTSAAGPFVVTSPNGFVGVSNKKPLTVTWNVAGTTAAPVNCTQVNIRLSTDGGFTFPTVLVSNTPNDGLENVTLPNVESLFCRIMVEASNNIFFDISNGNFGIQSHCFDNAVCSDIDFGNHFIRQFQLGSYTNNSTCSPNGYIQYNNTPVQLVSGATQSFAIRLGTGVVNHGGAMWIDYNDDGDFDDFGERVFASTALGNSDYTGSFTVPGNFQGLKRLRIRTGFGLLANSTQPCADIGFGETEDYWVNIGGYCFDNPTCSDIDFGNFFISRVRIGTLDNSSSCSPNGYSNFTTTVPQALLKSTLTYPITINTATGPLGVGVWIDYNNDSDFNDAGEFVYQSAIGSVGVFTGNIRIQSFNGVRRMRVRTRFNQTFSSGDACLPVGFGETEDYALSISGYCLPTAICSEIDFGDHFISSFQFPEIQNTGSGCSPSGYVFYPEGQFLGKVYLGETVGGNLTVAGGSPAGKAIWIDYNNDEDFNDPGEYVANSGTVSSSPTWTFTIPISGDPAVLGLHRMRVRSVFNAVPGAANSCTTYGFGETEDYMIDIGLGVFLSGFSQSLCTGRSAMLFFSTQGVFPPANQFTIEISNAAGLFNPGIAIGSGATSPIMVQIPDTLSAGNLYQLRIVSSVPSGYSSTLPNISLQRSPQVTQMSPNSGPPGTLVTFTGNHLGSVGDVFFGQFPGENLVMAPDGNSFTVVVPPGATSGPVFLGGACGGSGPVFTVAADCNLALSTIQPIPVSQAGCADGKISFAASGSSGSLGRAILFPATNLNPAAALDSVDVLLPGSGLFEGLSPGNYRIILQQGPCRDTSDLISIGVSNQTPTIADIQTTPSSSANDGSISFVVANPGCTPLTFIRATGLGFVYSNPVFENGRYRFSNLGAGTYGISIWRSGVRLDTATIEVPSNVLPPPSINPGTGVYADPLTVSISTAVSGAQVYYTTSGNIPVVGTSFTRLYTGPFQIIQSTTVRAIAVKPGFVNSPTAAAFITITNPGICAAPVVSPVGGSYPGSVSVTMSTTTPGGEIWYTTNGNTPRFDVPNTFTRRYTGPFSLFASTTIRAITIRSGLLNSSLVTVNYTLTAPAVVATPTFSPLPGTFSGSQSVSLSTSTPDAQIYYTTNGNVPRIDIPNSFTRLYTGPFVLTQTTTVRAQAVRTGWLPSGIAVGVYTFGGARLALEGEGEMPQEGEVSVYPNPSPGGLFFMQMPVEATEAVPFSVLALDGKEISSGVLSPGQPQRLDLGRMPAGLYQVKLQYPDRIKVLRLMK